MCMLVNCRVCEVARRACITSSWADPKVRPIYVISWHGFQYESVPSYLVSEFRYLLNDKRTFKSVVRTILPKIEKKKYFTRCWA